jgi:hypothetical protein
VVEFMRQIDDGEYTCVCVCVCVCINIMCRHWSRDPSSVVEAMVVSEEEALAALDAMLVAGARCGITVRASVACCVGGVNCGGVDGGSASCCTHAHTSACLPISPRALAVTRDERT